MAKGKAQSIASPNGPIRALTASRDALAVDLRSKRYTFDQIAAELDCDTSTAFRAYRRGMDALADATRETAAQIRDAELRTLELVECELLARVQNPGIDPRTRQSEPIAAHAQALLGVQTRRAKLLGLDAPDKIEHAGPAGGPIQLQLQLDFKALSDDELQQLRQLVAKATPAGDIADPGD